MDKGTNQKDDGQKEPIKMVIGQRNQSKGRWDKGTNQNGEKTKEPIKRTIGQRNNQF